MSDDEVVGRPATRRVQLEALLNEGYVRTGLRAASAARLAGLKSPSLLTRALSGERKLPPRKAAALADILGLPREAVLAAAGHPGRVEIDVANVVLQRSETTQVKVITDPRFVDSALFWWIFSKQPFVSAGIRCELVRSQWGNVPALVAEHDLALGFYNKQVVADTVGGVPAYEIVAWGDLTLYKGYALIGRADKTTRARRIEKFDDAVAWLARIRKKADLENRNPIIVTMTGDPRERLSIPYLADRRLDPSTFDLAVLPSADLAKKRFEEGFGDLFVGGLPQRLALRDAPAPYVEVLHSGINPFMASINSLVCSPKVVAHHRDILYTSMGIWFETVNRMKESKQYRRAVATEILALLDAQNENHSLTLSLFEEVFGKQGAEYEVFAGGPDALTQPLLATMQEVLLSVVQSNGPERKAEKQRLVKQVRDVFTHFHESFVAQSVHARG